MPLLVNDPILEEQLKAQRQLTGADRFDEVWEGVYIMAPLANDEHQDLQLGIAMVLRLATKDSGALVRAGVNVSDRDQGWEHNYRCPDIVLFMPDTRALNRGTHWVGGPDLAVEILSEGDRTREKLEFYEKVGVRELLIVDRQPWSLELLVLKSGRLQSAGTSSMDAPAVLRSGLIPMTFELAADLPRPLIVITHTTTGQRWEI